MGNISLLGHALYLSVITERRAWPGGTDALRSEETLIASDGSCNCMGSGAWRLVVCTIGSVKCFTGRVDPGVGENSPYRSESYGILAGLRYAVAAGLEGDIKHITDNESVVRVFQDCEKRGPSLVCSQDVWDEVIWYKILSGRDFKSNGGAAILKIAGRLCTSRTERTTWPTDWPPLGTGLHLAFGLSFHMAAGGTFAWAD
jgi:hypothetical protein